MLSGPWDAQPHNGYRTMDGYALRPSTNLAKYMLAQGRGKRSKTRFTTAWSKMQTGKRHARLRARATCLSQPEMSCYNCGVRTQWLGDTAVAASTSCRFDSARMHSARGR